MSKQTTAESQKSEEDFMKDWQKNWRSWGSWFSWGSPVGLSIFFLSLAGCAWIISKI